MFMDRGCEGHDGNDLAPCCRTSKFPFSKKTFQECMKIYVPELVKTSLQFGSNLDVGFRYDKRNVSKVIGIIVEFQSNQAFSYNFTEIRDFYAYMSDFFNSELQNAPEEMRKGWFVSHLGFHDLQNSITSGTPAAIGISIGIAAIFAFLTNLNILITLYAMTSIACAIFVTIGLLVIIGWELNILESVTISVAVGLSIDFSPPLWNGVQVINRYRPSKPITARLVHGWPRCNGCPDDIPRWSIVDAFHCARLPPTRNFSDDCYIRQLDVCDFLLSVPTVRFWPGE